YGQRSYEPHQQAEHMAAPTNAAFVKKVLANSEPSTHDPKRTSPLRIVQCQFQPHQFQRGARWAELSIPLN
ncbi:MAG: hypothetical protein WB689_13665, partial [Xanthobacteraceae bacterium]